jgi:hypothetical protein
MLSRRMAHGAAPRTATWHPVDVALLLVLCTAVAWPYQSSELGQDAIRDLLAADDIARHHRFPLAGPTFNLGAFALGPVWFYVLALPSLLGASLASSALLVGVLSVLKLPLAFRCGVVVVDRRFGWCLVAALCWAGLPSMQWLWWSTPNVVETCLWATALCALLAIETERPRWWVAAAALLGLAIHAHPTALLYAPPLLAAWLRTSRHALRAGASARVARTSAAMLAAFTIWFLPTLFTTLASAADAGTSSSAVAGAASSRLAAAPTVIRNALWSLPIAAWQSWLPALRAAAAAPTAAWLLAVVAGFAVTARREPSDASAVRRVQIFAAASVVIATVGLLVVTMLRPWVAFYTLYAMLPALAVVEASGHWLLQRLGGAPGKCVTWSAVALSLVGVCLLAHGAAVQNGAGLAELPLATLGNLGRSHAAGDELASLRIRRSPRASASFAHFVCGAPRATVHGTLAVALHEEHDLFVDRSCDRDRPRVLGMRGTRHVVGMPLRWLELAHAAPLLVADGIALGAVEQVVRPAQPIAAPATAQPFVYADESPDRLATPIDLPTRFVTRRDSAVLLTFLKPWGGILQLLRVTRGGASVEPAARTTESALWLGEPSGDPTDEVEWTLDLRTDLPGWIDVVTVAAALRTDPAPPPS